MYEELLKNVEKARAESKTIGLVSGSWDLFHIGHLRYILEARKLCDYLIIAMDSDEKIRKRKGNNRPIINEQERYDFLTSLDKADYVVIKDVNEPKWGLIKSVRPDVLVAIKENYTDEQIVKLEEYCGRVAILPRQAETSTSDKIRKILISQNRNIIDDFESKITNTIEEMKKRINYNPTMQEPIPDLIDNLKNATDWVCPVVASCFVDGKWYFGTNQSDFSIPKDDVDNRTELYYSTIEHAEINLLKKFRNIELSQTPIYTTLFPCDKCMKVLIDKGVKKIYYLEDHPNRNWSKRSHELALKNNVELINLLELNKTKEEHEEVDYNSSKYVYLPNARNQEQLDIMIDKDSKGIDPLAPDVIDQEIVFTTDYWCVSKNRFPYEGIENQFLISSISPIYKVEDINKEGWADLNNIWLRLKEEYNLLGGAMCFRFGDPSLSGASLKRLHAHIIVPKEDVKTKFTIGGNKVLKKGLKINNYNNQNS